MQNVCVILLLLYTEFILHKNTKKLTRKTHKQRKPNTT